MGRVEPAHEGDVADGFFGVGFAVGQVALARDFGDAHDLFLVTGMVDEDGVAVLDGAQVFEGEGVRDAIPHRVCSSFSKSANE